MFAWGPYPAAVFVGGGVPGEFISAPVAWLVVFAAMTTACSLLWFIGSLGGSHDPRESRKSLPIDRKAA